MKDSVLPPPEVWRGWGGGLKVRPAGRSPPLQAFVCLICLPSPGLPVYFCATTFAPLGVPPSPRPPVPSSPRPPTFQINLPPFSSDTD